MSSDFEIPMIYYICIHTCIQKRSGFKFPVSLPWPHPEIGGEGAGADPEILEGEPEPVVLERVARKRHLGTKKHLCSVFSLNPFTKVILAVKLP